MRIYLKRDGIEQGPYSLEVVRMHLQDGSFEVSDLARVEGSEDWRPVVAIPGVVITAEQTGQQPLPEKPRLSKLAVVALALGILSVLTMGIAFIPAIICGHVAWYRVKHSKETMRGKGFALAGAIMGYIGPALLVVGLASFAAGSAAINNARKMQAFQMGTSIAKATSEFHAEYGKLPTDLSESDTVGDVSFAKSLLGLDTVTNPRAVPYLHLKETQNRKSGVEKSTSRIFDPWGRGFIVILDTTGSGEVKITRGIISETLTGRNVAVYSLGPDGKPGTWDDVITW